MCFHPVGQIIPGPKSKIGPTFVQSHRLDQPGPISQIGPGPMIDMGPGPMYYMGLAYYWQVRVPGSFDVPLRRKCDSPMAYDDCAPSRVNQG